MASILAKKPVSISAPSAAETLGTTDKQRGDDTTIDRRKLRATGRTAQFNQSITPEEKKLFARLAQKAGVKQNVLLGDMVREWATRDGVPEEERDADRSRPMTFYGNDDIFEALEFIASTTKGSISAVIEDLVAERMDKLAAAGRLPKALKVAGKR